MNNTILKTNFNFNKQTKFYKGKVRDVYTINDSVLVMIASDRISEGAGPELVFYFQPA